MNAFLQQIIDGANALADELAATKAELNDLLSSIKIESRVNRLITAGKSESEAKSLEQSFRSLDDKAFDGIVSLIPRTKKG